jgi:hypothetical protein
MMSLRGLLRSERTLPRELYVSMWLRVSVPSQQHPIGNRIATDRV